MPTYEYQCSACDHRFEQFQSIKDKPLKKCPGCGKPKLERLIGTGGAVIFKGGGFYQTDYRSESYKKSAEADKAPSATSAASGSTGTDSSKSGSTSSESAKPAPSGDAKPKSTSGGESKAAGGKKKNAAAE